MSCAQPAPSPSTTVPGNIFLVGLMGAGKTSVGRLLARHFGKVFYDSDQEIERRTGVKIPIIFEIEGESGFRAREEQVLRELAALTNIVLATGGGAVLREENRHALKRNGTVVYLRASLDGLGGLLGGQLSQHLGLGSVFWGTSAMAVLATGCAYRVWRMRHPAGEAAGQTTA